MGAKLRNVVDNTSKISQGIVELTTTRVMIGIPAEKASREETEGESINNATLMYIHEHGAPEVNIPARPVVQPAADSIRVQVVGMLAKAAELAGKGDMGGMNRQFHAIGILGQNAMRKKITEGPFAPLSERTLAARRARGRTGTKPLIDTGQLRRALTYVIRKVKP